MKIPAIVKIQWVDSKTYCGWAGYPGPARDARVVSVGYLLNQTKECYTITTSLTPDGSALCQLDIPMAAVTVYTVVEDEHEIS